ncbi:MAG TPA: c-type cytochrome [Paludibaculum sp.]|jgi:putative heme-binding domain-containing protein
MRLIWAFLPFALCARTPDLAKGRALFVANCSFCHGAKGEGGRGPNLTTAESTHGRGLADLEKVISAGVPGSQMPGFGNMEPGERTPLVAFVASLSARAGATEQATGNAAAGRSVYEKMKCSMCHKVGVEGSVYGPELTRVGSGRSLQYLRDSITKPSADIMPEYEGVVVTTKEGVRVAGVRINEDTFSVQLRDLGQRFRLFNKGEVRSVAELKDSLMPPYEPPAKELDDLVAYLASLKSRPAGVDAKQAEGIR